MNSYLRKALPVCIFILTIAGLMLIPSLIQKASAQPPCFARICKVAPELPPESGVFFPFTFQEGGSSEETQLQANVGQCSGAGIEPQGLEVIEDPLPGWVLSDIECDDAAGVTVSVFENGVSFECLSEGLITCTFTKVRERNIPTLSEWGMIAAAGGLELIGVFFAVRRRRVFNS